MAGTLLSVGVIACAAVLAVGFTTAGTAAVLSQRLAGAADAAALAAADAASGAIEGVPCERAAEAASASGATLTSCELENLTATITVALGAGLLSGAASARAGQPP